MKCRANKPKTESRNTVVEYMTTAITYVLFEHGFEQQKVLDILMDIDDMADSMIRDYVTYCDIRRVLRDEYHFDLKFH